MASYVTQAVLPILRAQGGGHIVQISTTGGVGAFPTLGGYNASKWALEALSDALSQEVAAMNIRVTLIEPSGFATDWSRDSAVRAAPLPFYEEARKQMSDYHERTVLGDPGAVGPALLEIVDAANPPLRVLWGKGMVQFVEGLYRTRLATWNEWKALSERAAG